MLASTLVGLVLSDEPSHAWQSSVLLAQLGTGCSFSLPSAPALPMPWPAALFLCIHHAARLSSLLTGAILLPSVSLTVLPKSLPCLIMLFSLAPAPCPMSSVTAGTPSLKKRTMCWVPPRKHQRLVKVVQCNAKWWGFNSCAKCVRRKILEMKILSVIYPEVRYSKSEYKLQNICFWQWVPASCWADKLFLEEKELFFCICHPILDYTISC